MLHFYLLHSNAWLSLSASSRAVYIQLLSRYNGFNNGQIAYSVRDAARECRIARNTAANAFKELEVAGFIVLRTKGAFSRKFRHATEWLLTDYRDEILGEAPKKLFMRGGIQKPGSNKTITVPQIETDHS